MPPVNLAWNQLRGYRGYDVHLLPGWHTPTLLNEVWVERETAAASGSAEGATDLAVLFGSTLRPGVAGVHVAATGRVEIDASIPSGPARPRNFVVFAEGAATGFHAFLPIRIHIHASIRRMWLTPNPLTVWPDGQARLTVLAHFDDDVVGDVTYSSVFNAIGWESSDRSVQVSDEGVITGSPAARATITARWEGQVATAQVLINPERLAAPRDVELIAGSAPFAPSVPNVLFLSEGYPDTTMNRMLFQQVTDDMVRQIKTLGLLQPYPIIPINFWRRFIGSRETGETTLYALRVDRTSGRNRGQEFPEAALVGDPPVAGSAPYQLGELIYAAGLPVPADSGVDLPAKQSQWVTVFPDEVGNRMVGNTTVFDAWKALAGYRLANERDTAFGLAIGERPRARRLNAQRVASWNPRRTTRAHLDQLLGALSYSGLPGLGRRWVTGGPDYRLIFALMAGARRAGGTTKEPPLVACSLSSDTAVDYTAPALGETVLTGHGIPATAVADVVSTVAHETGHSFHLADEYGEGAGTPPPTTGSDQGNVQTTAALGGGVSGTPRASRGMQASLIKWRWPRIRHVAFTAAAPVRGPATGQILLQMRPGHGIRDGEFVRLRRWPLYQFPEMPSRLLQVGRATGGDLDHLTLWEQSVDLPSTGVIPPLDVSRYPADSLLIVPVRFPPSGPAASSYDLPLVAPVILEYLGSVANGGRPMADPTPHAYDEVLPRLPTGRRHRPWPMLHSRIIGLYEGGAEIYSVGVMRPAGLCCMRTNFATSGTLAPFCQVCRYLMVDLLQPLRHGTIDLEYDAEYPGPLP
jgi:hypothetical protein